MNFENIIPTEKKSVFKWIASVSLVVAFIWFISLFFGLFSSVTDVAKKELGPQAAIKKYEWFKDASNEITRKLNDIEIYETRLNNCYKATPTKCNLIEEQMFGLKSSYNSLVADYNSASSKFNWNLFNTENIPTNYKNK